MISRFFILRPVLSTVIAIIVILSGLLALPELEISRFPNIAPPTIRVMLRYTGASAVTIENSVVQVVEQQMSGLDNLLYFSSKTSSEGDANLSFFFDQKVDPDVAQMQVQNRMQNILTRLPQAVQDNGVTIRKVSDDTLQRIAFYCENGTMDEEDIADFVVSVLQDPISRLNGVGSISVFGSAYAVRIWLDEYKLAAYKLNPVDIVSAIREQNRQISSGQLGALPNKLGEALNITITSREMLSRVEDFEKIVLKAKENGAAIYLKDVAKIELGRESYTYSGSYNGHPYTTLSIDLTEGANAVDTAQRVADYLEHMEPLFPDGIKYAIPYDTVPYVKASLREVGKTLCEAMLLVALVILLFLNDLRATLIVCLTIPVVLSATITVLMLLGYSINTLTLFGMVLSIGLLVDDAIVVVENINRLMVERGLTPTEAALQSMTEISSALFGVGLVIAAVFMPMSFFSGATGKIYRQFSVTIVSAMMFSIAVALIITPALCAKYLKKPAHHAEAGRSGSLFIRLFQSSREAYLKLVALQLQHIPLCLCLTLGIAAASAVLFRLIPTSFLPTEDQGVLSSSIVMPAGSSRAQTQKVADEVVEYFWTHEKDNIEGIMMTLGFSSGAAKGQSTASVVLKLTPWDERPGKERSAQAIRDRAYKAFRRHNDARINFRLPASVRGLGSSSGFDVQVQNLMGVEHDTFVNDVNEIVTLANQSPLLSNAKADNLPDSPQLKVSFDDLKAAVLHLSGDKINENISIAWAGKYVNDFSDRGRVKKVYVQAAPEFRTEVSDLYKLHLVNSEGLLVPLRSIASAAFTYGPVQSQRFNGVSSIPISGEPAAGVSSGEAMAEIAKIISEHPNHYSYAWQGQSFQEQLLGGQTTRLFILSALIVFLCLAALYESWTIPLAVFFIVPFGILGALLMVYLRGLVNDVYLQIGLITSGGLAAKNAILLIEYAHKFRLQGMSLLQCAKRAALIRYRPIIMTSVAFLLGVLPLMFAHGAGAASQISIGSAIVGGTLMATFVGVSFIPVFFVLISWIFLPRRKAGK